MSLKRATLCLAFFVVIFLPKASFAASKIVIDELQVSSSDSTYDEYIKISNYGATEFPLTGYQLVKKTASGSTTNILATFKEPLASNDSFIVANKDGAFAVGAKYVYSNASLAYNSSVYIYEPESKKIIDLVAFGSYFSNYNEGTALQNPEDDDVYARINGGDTDNNASDFQLRQVVIPFDNNAKSLIVTEVYLNPAEGGEWIELFNPVPVTVSLKNLKICDYFGRVHCYNFKAEETIGYRSYLVLDQAKTRITLNNDGDAVALYNPTDDVIDETPESGEAAKGESFALFGGEWKWTGKPTREAQNVFVDTIEQEAEASPKAKSAKKTTKKAKVTLASVETEEGLLPEEVGESTVAAPKEVKAAETKAETEKTFQITQKQLGLGLIIVALSLIFGYTMFENKGKLNEIYHKFTGGNG